MEEGERTLQSSNKAPSLTAKEGEPASSSSKRKRKRRRSSTKNKQHIVHQSTLRNPTWSYIHLQHLSTTGGHDQSHGTELDALTAHLHLTAALQQFLGLHGTAITFDILQLSGEDLWIRVAAEDCEAVMAAAGGWVGSGGDGWRVRGWSSWDARVMGKGREGGQDLFSD